jgi:Zn-dependent metalloprotease
MAFGAILAVVAASGQGAPAFGASSPSPARAQSSSSPSPAKAQSIQVEQSRAVSAGQALGIGSGEKLVVKDVIHDADGSTHVRYNRTFNGLRVIGGDLVSHRDKSGKIKSVSWNASHNVGVASMTPKIGLASARAAGAKKASSVQETTSATKGELVVYAGGSPKATPKLAYDVLTAGVRGDQTPSKFHAIIDANTGATLLSFDEVEHSTGTGHGIFVGTVPIGTTAGPPFSMRDTVGNYTTDLNGLTTGTGTTFTDVDNIWGNGSVSDRASAAVDAHYGAGKTFDYYKNVQGRNGIWDTGVGARSRVHYGNGYQNAYWDGTQMTYGDGASNTHPLVELDVAGHEMTHGVTENTAGLVYAGESGGLNEATSDIFGTAVEWYANNASDTPDYLIGEEIDINGDGTPLRYMDRPSRDGASPDCWSPSLGGLDVHYSSGPLNHWFYLASEGSGAKVINGVPYNSPTCNASTVTGVGRAVAEKIWYRTLSVYLTSSNTYAAAREGAIQSAKDLYGATSTQCTRVAAAFSAIAVPVGGATCTTTTPPPSGSNLLRNPGFESGNALWSATSGVIDQWAGAGQPTHSGTWNAWLLGYGTTHYQSISQLVTIPAGRQATLSYYVHIDTAEPGTTPSDTMKVYAGSTALQTLSNANAASGYQLKTVNLSAYAGRTISLSFAGAENGSLQTSFVLDDLSVITSLAGFTGKTPTRVLDTRSGIGAPKAKLGAGATLTLTVPGLPAGVTAVALNVTATGPTAASFLTVYPGGTARPTASNLNFVAGQTIPNMVLVPLGSGGKVTFYNNAGTVNVIADLVGYFR